MLDCFGSKGSRSMLRMVTSELPTRYVFLILANDSATFRDRMLNSPRVLGNPSSQYPVTTGWRMERASALALSQFVSVRSQVGAHICQRFWMRSAGVAPGAAGFLSA